MSLNRTILVGRLTKDPDLRYTPNGVAVATFTLAVNRQFKKDGQQEADFINIVVWKRIAENVANFLKKGSNQGSNSFNQSSNSGNSGFKKNDDPFSNSGQPIDISDDDLPF
ncbi:hypothetical protein COK81_16950 [Bacillus thuringiensis]|uniref:Single-stranded DNA-binding protein n=1 Tax=Bacillus thuringiensis TaxID=1428 RepID=A0A9X7G1F4_BACTU|nr:single-stranded DNA-binding protein [Bacillus thuringiensis]PFT90097.1 hypothetical protein COK81_16950 [Bacillus thuringiensis]